MQLAPLNPQAGCASPTILLRYPESLMVPRRGYDKTGRAPRNVRTSAEGSDTDMVCVT